MMRSLLARRLVTGLSVVMLLLCQTAAATLVYAAASPQEIAPVMDASTSTSASTSAPCHHESPDADGNTPSQSCHDRCPSRAASFETVKFDIPAAGIIALIVYAVVPDQPSTAAAWAAPILARAAPPPIRLVYCRLLN
jgi:hypothetical protein